MSEFRDWFWEITQLRQGPDYGFFATFDADDAEPLADLVRHHALPNFRHEADAKPSNSQICANHISYIDEHTYERVEAARVAGEEVSIWYYTHIEVCDCTLASSRILSGSQHPAQPQTDTGLIVALAQSPKLTLVEWKIVYNGYSYGLVESGASAEKLLAYLQR